MVEAGPTLSRLFGSEWLVNPCRHKVKDLRRNEREREREFLLVGCDDEEPLLRLAAQICGMLEQRRKCRVRDDQHGKILPNYWRGWCFT